jgi:hypothetical protein
MVGEQVVWVGRWAGGQMGGWQMPGAVMGLGPWSGMAIAAPERGLGGVLIVGMIEDSGNGAWGV